MFVGFAICPDSSTLIPLDPADIKLDVIYSQHFCQLNTYCAVLLQILNIVQSELALPHVHAFSSHVGEVAPDIGAMSRPMSSSSLATVLPLADHTISTMSEFLN